MKKTQNWIVALILLNLLRNGSNRPTCLKVTIKNIEIAYSTRVLVQIEKGLNSDDNVLLLMGI